MIKVPNKLICSSSKERLSFVDPINQMKDFKGTTKSFLRLERDFLAALEEANSHSVNCLWRRHMGL